ncbi:phosphoenolpyruvate--protein phosphotransferase [bacterium]|nr:phosphoenolpyruvate--protein phosphotransferase [bacterium]
MGEQDSFIGKKTYSKIAFGEAYIIYQESHSIQPHRVKNIPEEIKILKKALEKAKNEIIKIKNSLENRAPYEIFAIFEMYELLIDDFFFQKEIEEEILKTGLNAPFILYSKTEERVVFFDKSEDPLVRKGGDDIRFVSDKIIFHLLKQNQEEKGLQDKILIAQKLSPLDLILYSYQGIKGIVLEEGDTTSHVAIVAHSMGLSYILGIPNITSKVKNGDTIVLDGFQGVIYKNPHQQKMSELIKKMQKQGELEQLFKNSNNEKQTTTIDNKPIIIQANLAIFEEISKLKALKPEGVGLFRTEFLFHEEHEIPSINRQVAKYIDIATAVPNSIPVTIRTFDFSADKTPFTLKHIEQHNPTIGLRGIRYAIYSNIFKEQFEALILASQKLSIKILIPMVSSITEVEYLKKVEAEILSQYNIEKKHKLGIMIEVPSSVYLINDIANLIDFLSFGTNDLMQFFLAADRGNHFINDLKNPLEPTFLRFLNFAVQEGLKNNLFTSICGEIASNPLLIPILVGMGFESISCSPFVIPEVKNIVSRLSFEECKRFKDNILKLKTPKEVEEEIYNFINANYPDISELLIK